MANVFDYVDFGKEAALRQQEITQAEKGQFELAMQKKAYADKMAQSKGIENILKGYSAEEEAAKQTAPRAPTDAGPGGYDPTTGTTGEDRQQAATLKDQMAAQQQQGASYTRQAKMFNDLMLNAAKNNDPETALKFMAQRDGLEEKFRKNKEGEITTTQKLWETQGQLANSYLANPTDENWYSTVREAIRLGLPDAQQLFSVPRDKREAVAKAAIKKGETVQQELTAQLNAAKLAEKSREFYDGLEVKKMIADNTMRNQALNRELRAESVNLQKGARNTAMANAMLGKITNRLTQAKEDYHEADTEWKEAEARKKDIEGNIIIIKDKEERKRQLAELDDVMAKANLAREAAKRNRDTLNEQFDKLSTMAFPELGAVKDEPPKAPEAPKAPVAPGVSVPKELQTKFNKDPQTKGYKLGKKGADGKYEVLDANGKLVGYYE